MTAKQTGTRSFSALWLALKRVREHWILVVFLATALYGARDVIEEAVQLPLRVEALQASVGNLEQGISRLEAAAAGPAPDLRQALSFPGMRHAATDGHPGDWVMAEFRPVHALRADCQPAGLAAYMIDAERHWFSVRTDLAGWPRLDSLEELAFGVEVHPRMAVGRAQLLIQIVHDCGGRLQVDSAPALHFRVLEARTP